MNPIPYILIFLVCWILLMVKSFIITSHRKRFRTLAAEIFPSSIRNNESLILMPFSTFRKLFVSFIRMLITFASRRAVTQYLDTFYDLSAIEVSENPELNHTISRLIHHTTRYYRTWIIMVIALIAAVVTWSG
jgi:hypothetical protein